MGVVYDAVYIPGGKGSIETLKNEGDVVEFINDTLKHYKAIAATGEGVELLMMAPESKAIALDKSQSNGHVTSDNGIISSQNAANIKNVAEEFVSATARYRHWTRTINEIKPPVQEPTASDRIVIGS
jgi:catalase